MLSKICLLAVLLLVGCTTETNDSGAYNREQETKQEAEWAQEVEKNKEDMKKAWKGTAFADGFSCEAVAETWSRRVSRCYDSKYKVCLYIYHNVVAAAPCDLDVERR